MGGENSAVIHCPHDRMVAIDSLRFHPKNRNSHSPEQVERLAQILRYQGWRYPVKISNLSGFVTSGHGRVLAATHNGWKEVPVSYQDYEDETQEYADLVADNSIAAWSELDLSGINTDIADLGPDFDIDLLGIKDFTIDVSEKHEGDADAVPEVPKVAKTKRGELWVLGEHRVLCGDATSAEDVARLMGGEKADMVFTDPPYGISLVTDYKKTKPTGSKPEEFTRPINSFGPIQGDAQPFDAKPILDNFPSCEEVFIFGANNFCHTIPDYQAGSWICWDRTGGAENLDEMLGSSFELCWSKQRHKYRIARVTWKGVCGHVKHDDGEKKIHPSMKPVALVLWFFDHWGKKTNRIWDGFLGSGSTLIACEKTNRRCFGMEIEPLYVDVILSRWAKFTGQDPIREDGVTWSSLQAAG